ncbi:MAG: hypothetical protein OK456_08645 [Thaumarchaeota archaeon]|nr:hypothetical protein [Nitrososphaerota archaeon]
MPAATRISKIKPSLVLKLSLFVVFVFLLYHSPHPAYATSIGLDPGAGASEHAGCAPAAACQTPMGMTTSDTNDVYVVMCSASEANAPFSKPIDSNNLLSLKKQLDYNSSQALSISVWWSYYAGTLTGDKLMCSLGTGSTNLGVYAFAVKGEDLSNPFDSNTAIPNTNAAAKGTSATCTETTTNANDFLFSGVLTLGATNPRPPTGWIGFGSDPRGELPSQGAARDTVSSSESSSTVAWTVVPAKWAAVCDALQSQETEVVTTASNHADGDVLTISGCDASLSNIGTTNTTHMFTADHDCSISYKTQVSHTSRQAFAGGGTRFSYTTGSAGSESKSIMVYYELNDSLDVVDRPLAPTGCSASCYVDAQWNGATIRIKGTVAGVADTTVCSVTPAVSTSGTYACGDPDDNYVDYGATYAGQVSTGSGTTGDTRWACGGNCTSRIIITGGQPQKFLYFLQYKINLQVSASTGSPAFTGTEVFHAEVNQTGAVATVTLNHPASSCSDDCATTSTWIDYGSLVRFSPYGAISSRGSNTARWYQADTAVSDGWEGQCVGVSGGFCASNELTPGSTFTAVFTLQYELTGNAAFDVRTVNSMTPNDGPTNFAWMFGLANANELGGNSEARAVEVSGVQNLTNVFGGDVAIVHAVGLATPYPPSSNWIASQQTFINSMYAAGAKYVICRLSLDQNFNMTSPVNLNQVVTFAFSPQPAGLGCDGMWLDGAGPYYSSVGEYVFNRMMQNMTTTFTSGAYSRGLGPYGEPPLWIINGDIYRAKGATHTIVPLSNDTWQQDSWILVYVSSHSAVSTSPDWLTNAQQMMSTAQQYFGDKVLLHWDDDGAVEGQPMGLFAANSTALQEMTISDALGNMSNYGEQVLIPFFGGAYYDQAPTTCPSYNAYTVQVNSSNFNGYPVTQVANGGSCNRGTAYSFETSMLHSSWYNYGAVVSITLNGAYTTSTGVKTVITSYAWDGGPPTGVGTDGTFTVTVTMDAPHALDLGLATQGSPGLDHVLLEGETPPVAVPSVMAFGDSDTPTLATARPDIPTESGSMSIKR